MVRKWGVVRLVDEVITAILKFDKPVFFKKLLFIATIITCLLYTSDAADE